MIFGGLAACWRKGLLRVFHCSGSADAEGRENALTHLLNPLACHHSPTLLPRKGRVASLLALMAIAMLSCCAQPWHEVAPMQKKALEKLVNNSRTEILAVSPSDAQRIVTQRRLLPDKGREILTGSAAPLTSDGWFLTANHVVADLKNQEVIVIYDITGAQKIGRAKVMWQDKAADLALIKAEMATPAYYHFTPRDQDLTAGTKILHAGMTTGGKAQIGELSESVSGRGAKGFEHTLRLAPGDSGGPLIVFSGELVGVNSAVGLISTMDTTFFDSSRSSRPDPDAIMKIIARNASSHH